MTDKWLDHARLVYLDCISEGWGVFRIAELFVPKEERQTWTETELISAMARQLRHEAGDDPQQRSAQILNLTNPSRNRSAHKQDRSANSLGRDLRIHR